MHAPVGADETAEYDCPLQMGIRAICMPKKPGSQDTARLSFGLIPGISTWDPAIY